MEQRSTAPQENIVIRQLKIGDIQQTIEIHVNFFGSQSGLRFLENAYYPTLLHPRSAGFCLVAVSKEQIAGFCSGALDASDFHRHLLRAHPWECLMAASRMIFKGKEIWNQMAYSFRQLYASRINMPGGRIFFIAVHKAFQQQGIASQLVTEALAFCRSQGLKRCWSRTPKSNTVSHQFHTSLGFRTHPELSKRDRERFILYHDLGSIQNP